MLFNVNQLLQHYQKYIIQLLINTCEPNCRKQFRSVLLTCQAHLRYQLNFDQMFQSNNSTVDALEADIQSWIRQDDSSGPTTTEDDSSASGQER